MTCAMTTTTSGTQNALKLRTALGCLLCLLSLLIGAGCSSGSRSQSYPVVFWTPYQLVLLSNNAVYFGKLEGWGTPNLVLTDVFYISTTTNPETKQVQSTLMRRSGEAHAPDKMYLSSSQVVFVEPISPGSKVAKLIDDANANAVSNK
jgi:hypothetical protein